jgi:hypothetical protein
MARAIALSFVEASLKRSLRRHLKTLGFHRGQQGELLPPGASKDVYRALHLAQRKDLLRSEDGFIRNRWPQLKSCFANGNEINPGLVSPVLELVPPGTWQSDLFRLACLTWSIPVSAGYGRRLRFLVWDESNRKLMGVIGLADPVFNLRARDSYIGWSAQDRRERLIYILDAFALGAVAPYNKLLGGKLIACLVRSREVLQVFNRNYATCSSTIAQNVRPAHLVAITTTSALGRSSVYNRLRLLDCRYFESVGYTEGWGHFHMPDRLFHRLRDYLRRKRDPYADNHRFGDGPSWRFRAIRQALSHLGLRPNLLRHGLAREVFFCSLAENSLQVLRGNRKRPQYENVLSVRAIGELARDRWMLPRSRRDEGFLSWRAENLFSEQAARQGVRQRPIEGGRDGLSEFQS